MPFDESHHERLHSSRYTLVRYVSGQHFFNVCAHPFAPLFGLPKAMSPFKYLPSVTGVNTSAGTKSYQTVCTESAHTATTKRVRASINSMCVRSGMILCSAKGLHINAVRILPFVGIVVSSPIFAKIIDTCC